MIDDMTTFSHPHEKVLLKIKAALCRDAFATQVERYQAESLFGKLLVGGPYEIDNGSKIAALYLAYDRGDDFMVQAILWDMFVLSEWPGVMRPRFIELMCLYKESRFQMAQIEDERERWTRGRLLAQEQFDLMRTAFDELMQAFFARRQHGN